VVGSIIAKINFSSGMVCGIFSAQYSREAILGRLSKKGVSNEN